MKLAWQSWTTSSMTASSGMTLLATPEPSNLPNYPWWVIWKKVYFLSEGQTNQVHIMARTQFFTGNLDGMSTAVQLCIIGTVGKIQKYQISEAHQNNSKMAKTFTTAREAVLSRVVNWLVLELMYKIFQITILLMIECYFCKINLTLTILVIVIIEINKSHKKSWYLD